MSRFESLNCPFPGLRSFEPGESHLFFGRENEIEEVLQRLREHRFLAVLGPSGCGKSSLVKAGVLPRLHSFDFPQVQRWHLAVMKPQGEPFLQLARALSKSRLFDLAGWRPLAASSPDGQRIAMAHSDGSVRIYRTGSHSDPAPEAPGWTQEESALQIGTELISTLVFWGEEKILVGSRDGRLRLLSIVTGQLLGQCFLPGAVRYCRLENDGPQTLCLTDDGHWVQVDLDRWQTNLIHRVNGLVESVAKDPKQSFLFFGTSEGGLWQMTANDHTFSAECVGNHESAVTALAISPTGHLAVGTEDGLLEVRELGSPDVALRLQLDHAIELLEFSSDACHLAAGGRAQVSMFRRHTNTFVASTPLEGGSNVFTFLENQEFLCASLDGGVRLWRLEIDGWHPRPWLINPDQTTVSGVQITGTQSVLMVCDDGEIFLRSPDARTALWQLPGQRAQTQRVLESILRESRHGLVEALSTDRLAPQECLLILVDQFEELFTFSKGRDEAESFINLLLEPLQQESGPARRVYVMLTMRSDYLKECHQFSHLPRVLNDCQYLVPVMSRAQFDHAVRQPLTKNQIAFDEKLVLQILNAHYGGSESSDTDSANEQFDQLPLLQHLLSRIWHKAKECQAGKLDLDLYEQVGGGKALDQHLERLTQTLPEALVKRVFQSLTTKDQGRAVRRDCTLAELVTLCGDEAGVREALECFRAAENSVLMPPSSQPLFPDTSIDISHEAVMRQWDRLGRWLDEEQRDAAELQRLVDNYRRRDRSELLNPELREFLTWWEQRRPSPTWISRYQGPEPTPDVLHSFLMERERVQRELDEAAENSRQRQRSLEQKQARTLRIALMTFVCLFIGSVGLWLNSAFAKDIESFANIQVLSGAAKVQAKVSGRPGLLLSALAMQLQTDRENPALLQWLALEIGDKTGWYRSSKTLDPMQAAFDNFQMCSAEGLQLSRNGAVQNIGETILTGHEAPITSMAFSQDKRWLATGSENGTARLWDLKKVDPSQDPVVLEGHEYSINSMAFSEDGRWLATQSGDGTTRLWDLKKVDPSRGPVVLEGYKYSTNSMVFSEDGRWLATQSRDGTARLWDLKKVDPSQYPVVLEGYGDPILSMAFSEDGRWLATGSRDGTACLWNLTKPDPGQDPVILKGHGDSILSMAFSKDGRWLATGSDDGIARLWDLEKADPSQDPVILKGHEDSINSVAFSEDGRWLATQSGDGTTRLWDLKKVDPSRGPVVLEGYEYSTNSMVFSEDERWLATQSGDGTVRLWDLKKADPSRDPIVLKRHEGPIHSLAFSPDERWLATRSDDGTARLWDLKKEDPSQDPVVLKNHEAPIASMAFSQDKRWLATGSDDGTARLWDIKKEDPSQDPVILKGHGDSINSVAFNEDGRWLATGSRDSTARLWDLKKTAPIQQPVVQEESSGTLSAISDDGYWMATSSDDATARIWDLTKPDPSQDPLILKGHEGRIYSMAFSGDGHWLATGSDDTTARLWDLTKPDPSQNPLVFGDHESIIFLVAFSKDNRWLATASGDGIAPRLWDLKKEDPSQGSLVLKGHEGPINSVALSGDGHWLATGSDDGTTRLWDLKKEDPNQNPLVLKGHKGRIISTAFSGDGAWLATGSDDSTARLWDLKKKDPSQDPVILKGHGNSILWVAFSEDGAWLATGSWDSTARLWNLTKPDPGQDPVILKGHGDSILSMAFSKDGRWLATGSRDSTARLWNLRRQDPSQQSLVLRGHKDGISFSPDGRWLATGSGYGTARLWDLKKADPSQNSLILKGHEESISSLAFSKDGSRLATSSSQSVRLWDLKLPKLINDARSIAGRKITASEVTRFGLQGVPRLLTRPDDFFDSEALKLAE